MVKVIEGSAGFHSVMFCTNNYKSRATRMKDGEIVVELTKRPIPSKFERFLLRIPIVRGVYLLIEVFLRNWKIYLFDFLTILTFIYIANVLSGDTMNTMIDKDSLLYQVISFIRKPINALMIIIFVVMISGIAIRGSSIGKYHAAEHMTDNSYCKFKRLNVNEIMKQTRVHASCGSNLIWYVLISFFLLSFIFNNILLLLFLAFIFAYEIFRLDLVLLRPFYWLGGLFQYILFTSQPKQEHIEVAVAAYQGLIDKESE